MQLQKMLQQCTSILNSLRANYAAAAAEGINLPAYEALTQRFRLHPAWGVGSTSPAPPRALS